MAVTTEMELENRRLRRAVQELGVLNDLAFAIGGLADVDEILQIIIRKSLKALPSEQGTITLIDDRAEVSANTLVRELATDVGNRDFHPAQALLGRILLHGEPLIVNDRAHDERFSNIEWDPEIRSLLCVPLRVRSKLIGILTLYNDRTGSGFQDEDLRLLSIIGAESAQIIENARLQEQERAMEQQVELAAEVQRHLLPETLPSCSGYEVAAANVSALVVGGDYYDFIPLEDGRLAICLGDVSGKGLPAALLMANVQATMRLLAHRNLSPCDAMRQANDLLVRCTAVEKFVTFFYSILDQGSHELRFCNAGHNPPLLIRANEVRRLRTRGVVLGVLDRFDYNESVELFEPGDVVFAYTDGVTEALDPRGVEYGEDRLVDLLVAHRDQPVRGIERIVLDALREHAAGHPQSDDITLAIVKRCV